MQSKQKKYVMNDIKFDFKKCEHCKHFVDSISACMLFGYKMRKCGDNLDSFKSKE